MMFMNEHDYQLVMKAVRERDKLLAAVKKHHAQKADDRCWMDDTELYAAAGLPPADVTVDSCSAMLANCERYVTLRMEGKAGEWKSYAELEAERNKLLHLLKQLIESLDGSHAQVTWAAGVAGEYIGGLK